MPDPNQPQVQLPSILEKLTNAAASKSWLSGATGAGTVLVVLGVLEPESSKSIIEGMQTVMDGFGTIVGGFKKIYLALPAGALVWLAGSAGTAGTLFGALLKLSGKQAKESGITVLAPDAIANAVPGANVMAQSDAVVVAKPEVAAAVAAQAPSAPVVSQIDAATSPELIQK